MNRDVGFKFPLQIVNGRVATVGGDQLQRPTNEERDEAVLGGVQQVLLASKQSRVMLGNFGAGLNRWLFTPISGVDSLMPIEAAQAVREQCPRAVVTTTPRVTVYPLEGVVEPELTVRHNDSDRESVVRVAVRG